MKIQLSDLRKTLVWLAITSLGFYLFPLFKWGNGMGLMLLELPLIVFVCAAVYGFRSPFGWSYFAYSLMVSVRFAPTIFIYYNSTASIYTLIFGVIALGGTLTGRLFGLKAL